MSDDPEHDERVGYGRPPARNQFRKGQTGNPGGRPKKRAKTEFDLDKLLDRPLTVKIDGEPREMQPKEVELRQLVEKAIKKQDLTAIAYLLELFTKYQAIEPPQRRASGGVVQLPKNLPWSLAIAAFQKLGLPPWKAKDLAPLKASYLETRSEIDRIGDEIIGYDL